MKIKKKVCSSCGELRFIWSNGRCKHCSNTEGGVKMNKYSDESKEVRKVSRSCLEEFYVKHMKIISATKRTCLNCGVNLLGHVSEVAHILPKSSYKSVQCNDYNAVYLCGFLQNNCHADFDNYSADKVAEMKCFPYIVSRYKILKPEVVEDIHFKILEKYEPK